MRHTRSSAKASTSSARQPKKEEESSDRDIFDETGKDIKDHLFKAQEGLEDLVHELKSLRKRNDKLSAELASLRDAEEVKKSNSSRAALQEQVKDLKGQVRQLEKAREKDQREIKAHVAKELQSEAADLEEPADHDAGETTHDMRKLLRRFHDLMQSNVLDEVDDKPEECPVCMEPMQPKQCSSLPCEHIICNDCLKQICAVDWEQTGSEGERGLEITKCPHCRDKAPREDAEAVLYTATQRWDELLEVAQEWAKMDMGHQAVDETSEEEDQEDFINDKSTDASSTAPPEEASDTTPEDEDSKPASEGRATPDNDDEAGPSSMNGRRSYLESPTKAKRKRMEALAAERSKKKRL